MLKKQETGRSMIEMLGVLAIIGVLSVGGIAGYTTAMRSYKANEIVNATSMLYTMGLASNGGEGDATNLTYTGSIGASLSALKEITYNNGAIIVEITEDAVCNQVKTKLGDKATGDCSTQTNGAYSLTVTLGEVVQNQSTKCVNRTSVDSCTSPCVWYDGACHGQSYDSIMAEDGWDPEKKTAMAECVDEEEDSTYCYCKIMMGSSEECCRSSNPGDCV